MTTTLSGQLDVQPIAALTFGIPVTNALYGALQKAQGLNEDLDGDAVIEGTSETATEADIIANMPSLTKEQVAALMKGSIGEWSDVQYGGVPLTATAGISAPADTRVTICRRTNGSGTQAQLNANFLNKPCALSADSPAVDNTTCTDTKGNANPALPFCAPGYATTTATSAGTVIVHENSGSGDVTECLDQLQAANRWAIGVQSMEKDSTEWSFIKINGEEPTLENVATGNYFDWAATTIQWRNTTVNGVPAPSGDMLTILNAIRVEAGKPAVLDALNDKVSQNIGATGYLGLAGSGVASPFNPDLPVMQYTRDGKTCNVQKAVGTVDFD
jgi:ABC-type phosphate transport system substrate-binding protein